jgi:hypothetical protein
MWFLETVVLFDTMGNVVGLSNDNSNDVKDVVSKLNELL